MVEAWLGQWGAWILLEFHSILAQVLSEFRSTAYWVGQVAIIWWILLEDHLVDKSKAGTGTVGRSYSEKPSAGGEHAY